MKKLLQFVVAVVCLHLVKAQCTQEILEAADTTMVASTLAQSLAIGASTPPQVNIMSSADINVVCLAVNTNPGTYRSASLVVRYTCVGADCPTPPGTVCSLSLYGMCVEGKDRLGYQMSVVRKKSLTHA